MAEKGSEKGSKKDITPSDLNILVAVFFIVLLATANAYFSAPPNRCSVSEIPVKNRVIKITSKAGYGEKNEPDLSPNDPLRNNKRRTIRTKGKGDSEWNLSYCFKKKPKQLLVSPLN